MKSFCLTANASKSLLEHALGILSLQAPYGWQEKETENGGMVFIIYSDNFAVLSDLAESLKSLGPDISLKLEEKTLPDPLDAWKEFFTPVECGSRFVVLPPWLANSDFGQRLKIVIEPKSAFGTGHHATTELCLTIISDLAEKGIILPGDTFLDLGCGTGILGIGASLLGLSGIGIDIDPLAIINANENRHLNNVNDLKLIEGSLEAAQDNKFNLIMANILARPLIEMAPQICACLKKKGSLILSGILTEQADAVENVYQECGLAPARRYAKEEWTALLWHNLI